MNILEELKKYSYRVIKPHPLLTGNSNWTEENLKNNWGSIVQLIGDGKNEFIFSPVWFLKLASTPSDEDGSGYPYYFLDDTHRIPAYIVENNPEYFEKIDSKALMAVKDRLEKEARYKTFLELKKEFEG